MLKHLFLRFPALLRPRRTWRRRVAAAVVPAPAATALLVSGAGPSHAAPAWDPKPSPMTSPLTNQTNQVPVDHPLPEYPRPQLTRPDWADLNGIWDFAVTSRDAGQPTTFGEQIRVPFVPESALSGVQRKITQNCAAKDGGNGDVIDNHNYVGPGNTPTEPVRASVLGEYGGLGYRVPGHEWYPGGGFSYEDQPTTTALNNRLVGLLDGMRENTMPAGGLSASVYTQITDVENEANGLMSYDRHVVKVDQARVRAANQALIAASRSLGATVKLPVGQNVSIRVTTPGYTDRYIRHYDGLGFTEVVNAASGDLLKQDATWTVRPGPANRLCYSFESRNYPGEYLRHREFRVRREASDGSTVSKEDATWCPVQGSGGVRMSAAGFPGQYLRHINAELWLAQSGSTHTWDNSAGFTEDTTWAIEPPWAP